MIGWNDQSSQYANGTIHVTLYTFELDSTYMRASTLSWTKVSVTLKNVRMRQLVCETFRKSITGVFNFS